MRERLMFFEPFVDVGGAGGGMGGSGIVTPGAFGVVSAGGCVVAVRCLVNETIPIARTERRNSVLIRAINQTLRFFALCSRLRVA